MSGWLKSLEDKRNAEDWRQFDAFNAAIRRDKEHIRWLALREWAQKFRWKNTISAQEFLRMCNVNFTSAYMESEHILRLRDPKEKPTAHLIEKVQAFKRLVQRAEQTCITWVFCAKEMGFHKDVRKLVSKELWTSIRPYHKSCENGSLVVFSLMADIQLEYVTRGGIFYFDQEPPDKIKQAIANADRTYVPSIKEIERR